MIARYPTVKDYVDSEECTWDRFPEALESGRLPEMYFCCGDQDLCYPKVQEFLEYAEGLGAENIRFEVLPGYNHMNCCGLTIEKALAHFGL